MSKFVYIFFYFFLYSVLGYLVEITYCTIDSKKPTFNRGFCLGPYCPIYGVGSVLMVFCLGKYKDDPITLFLMSAFVCSLVEYITSFILEKIFKARWWDYSAKRFNIEGRICLENSFLFGLGGLLVTYIIHPILTFFTKKIPYPIFLCLTIILFIIFLTDEIITLLTLVRLKVAQKKFQKKDATDEITKLIRLEIVKNKNLVWRLLKAFPNAGEENEKSELYKVKAYLEKRYEKKRKFHLFK